MKKKLLSLSVILLLLSSNILSGNSNAAISNYTKDSNSIETVVVNTTEQFVNAIGSNKKIILKSGKYNLEEVQHINKEGSSVVWKDVDENGKELTINNIKNLKIIGTGKVEIVAVSRFANILSFSNASNVELNNVILGHTPEPGICSGGVLKFDNSSKILIRNSKLYGCGSIGLDLSNVDGLKVTTTDIYDCSWYALSIYNCQNISINNTNIFKTGFVFCTILINDSPNIEFNNCNISQNTELTDSLFSIYGNSDVLINNCTLDNNSKDPLYDTITYLFKMTEPYTGESNGKLIINNSTISNNNFNYFSDNTENIIISNYKQENNTW